MLYTTKGNVRIGLVIHGPGAQVEIDDGDIFDSLLRQDALELQPVSEDLPRPDDAGSELDGLTYPKLKKLAAMLDVSATGNKEQLLERIGDCDADLIAEKLGEL